MQVQGLLRVPLVPGDSSTIVLTPPNPSTRSKKPTKAVVPKPTASDLLSRPDHVSLMKVLVHKAENWSGWAEISDLSDAAHQGENSDAVAEC